MNCDYLIIGAGFAGSILAERIATQLNKKVVIIDKNSHIGGHCYDYVNENGILIHKYGAHIFHTTNKKVWDYLSKFTDWNLYFHHVLAVIEGKQVFLPFNINSIYKLFPPKYAEKLVSNLIEKYGYGIKVPILKLLENDDKELKFLADYIYKNVFQHYTFKQWGFKPEELDHSVSSRVPIYISRDDRYFQDPYQGIPISGYTSVFNKILNHKNINVILETELKSALNEIKYKKLIYTGPIDYFFDYMYGKLPYRSLRFELRNLEIDMFQDAAVVNYPNNFDYTRIVEFKHFNFFNNKLNSNPKIPRNCTTIAYEYPQQYEIGVNEPFYPIPKKENDEIYAKYAKEVVKSNDKIFFAGRLADYKYYNMDQVIAIALQLFEKKIAKKQ